MTQAVKRVTRLAQEARMQASIQLLDATPIKVDDEAFSEPPTQGEGLSDGDESPLLGPVSYRPG